MTTPQPNDRRKRMKAAAVQASSPGAKPRVKASDKQAQDVKPDKAPAKKATAKKASAKK